MKALVFNNTDIPVVLSKDGVPFVSVRHVCESLGGIEYSNQLKKLKSSPEFNCGDITTVGNDGKNREMFCIQSDQAHLWVAGISAAKITNPERQKAFIAYKHECANTLYTHFMNKGEDMFGIAQELLTRFNTMDKNINAKLNEMLCVQETVFGDDKTEIMELVNQVAEEHGVDGRTVWGWIQTECDVASYKKQNLRIKNFLRNKLGKGIKLVKEEEQ